VLDELNEDDDEDEEEDDEDDDDEYTVADLGSLVLLLIDADSS